VSQSDPTDNALAAIASILDNPEPPQPPPLPREAAKPVAEKPIADEKPLAPEQLEADGYCKIGPGPIANLAAALTAVRHVGKPNFRLLIDTMHFVRSGSGAVDIAALDANVIGYVQLCDAPLRSRHASYMDEALHERMVPGTGELPLLDILAALPKDVVIGLEVPQRSLAEAGVGPYERVGQCVEATRGLLARSRAAAAHGPLPQR